MLSTTAVQVFSITFDVLGQVAILLLIGTLLWAKSLPQSSNPFLLNFLLTTLFTQIPPSLLFFSGDLGRDPPEWLCSTQSILMDGVSPMAGLAWLIVVYHTWTDLKATLLGGTPLGKKSYTVKIMLLLTPYLAFMTWSMTSLAAVLVASAHWQLDHLVFCANESVLGVRVRRSIGLFLVVVGFFQFFLEILIVRLIYRTRNTTRFPDIKLSFTLRVFIFCLAQLIPLVLAIVNSAVFPNYIPLKQVTQMLVSANAFGTFLVFGTQRHVINAWKFWKWGQPSSAEVPTASLDDDNDLVVVDLV